MIEGYDINYIHFRWRNLFWRLFLNWILKNFRKSKRGLKTMIHQLIYFWWWFEWNGKTVFFFTVFFFFCFDVKNQAVYFFFFRFSEKQNRITSFSKDTFISSQFFPFATKFFETVRSSKTFVVRSFLENNIIETIKNAMFKWYDFGI